MTRRLLALGAATGLVGLLLAAPVRAADDDDAFRAQPTAATATRNAKEALNKGNIARAINWAERAARSPGLTPEMSGWIGKVRADLRWRLADEGYGALAINVRPAAAVVVVDGHDLLLRATAHVVWLKEGSHHLNLSAPDHADVEQIVEAARGERRVVDFALALTRLPVLAIEVQPDCDVWVDNVFAGPSTRKQFSVRPGSHILELRRAGWQSFVKEMSFSLGEVRQIVAKLESTTVADGPRPTASTVDRSLTPKELAAQAERHTIGTAPTVDSPLDAGLGLGKKTGATQRPAGGPDRPPEGPAPPETEKPNAGGASAPAPAHSPDGALAANEGGAPAPADGAPLAGEPAGAVDATEAPSAPWSAGTKGWLWAAPGLLVTGGGAGLAIMGARLAETANQDVPRGAAEYANTYDRAKSLAYLGYAAAGVGVVATSAGAWYLIGHDGLSRAGKGWATTTLGMAALGVAGWLYWDARALGLEANGLPASDPDYDRRFDQAGKQALTAYGVGAGGVLLAGTGLWLALRSGPHGRATRPDAAPQRRLTLGPSPVGTGGALMVTW